MVIYTDGSCSGNGKEINFGGFGIVVLDNDGNIITTYSKAADNTTNNREELKAILFAMLRYGKSDCPIVYSDSAYAVNTFTNWMFNWASNGWIKTTDKRPPENLDLIQAYYDFYQRGYRIDLRKVRGHSGNIGNELADKLATGEIKTFEEAKMFWDTYIK